MKPKSIDEKTSDKPKLRTFFKITWFNKVKYKKKCINVKKGGADNEKKGKRMLMRKLTLKH